ncbi:hypothetical protein ACKI2N_026430 [Cupriavidus sp. 30B13]|uniref:hypothetical protein n=1 Tax=Cupriavidus sp. 30B13 TaxID=3384241 RepID=UPI003B8FD13C
MPRPSDLAPPGGDLPDAGARAVPPRRTLTDYRYGSHSGTLEDPPASTSEAPAPAGDPAAAGPGAAPAPYRAEPGEKAPAGVARYGMYGVGPDGGAPPQDARVRPAPGPAVLGQYDGGDPTPRQPASDAQVLGVVEERLAELADPHRLQASCAQGVLTLRGKLRDGAMRDAVEACARACPGVRELRTEWTYD